MNLEVDAPGVWKVSGEDQLYLEIKANSKFEQYRWYVDKDKTYFNVQKGDVYLRPELDSLVYSTKYSSCFLEEKQSKVTQRFKSTTAMTLEIETPAGTSHYLERVDQKKLDDIKSRIAKGLWEEKCFTESSFDKSLILEDVGYKAEQEALEKQKLKIEREELERSNNKDLSKRRSIPTGLPKDTIDPDRPLQA